MAAQAAKSGQVKVGDLTVNRLGYGAMRVTGEGVWGPPKDHGAAIAVLKRTVELGVTFIDTADAYGPEVSENLIREALHPYGDVVIATKGGLTRSGPGIWTPDGRPEHLRSALEGSLERLGVETIDLYQLHTVDPNVPMEDSLGALVEAKAAGLIRNIGLSNVSLDQLKLACELTEIASVQNSYNVTARDSEDVLAFCAGNGLAFIPYFPIGGDGSDLSVMQAVADKHGATVHQVALAWLLAHSPAMLPIPGTSSVAHLEDNLGAVDLLLDADDMTTLDALGA